jgi:phosphoglycolate phosphatase-like HAD superfamily hydrolase
MGDLLVLWDVDGTLLNAGGVGGDLYETVFSSIFGRSCGKLAPMAGRTDRAIILETLEMAGIPEPRRHVDPFIEGLRSQAPLVYEAVERQGRALPGAAEAIAAIASATVGKSTIGFAVPGTALLAPDAASAPDAAPAPAVAASAFIAASAAPSPRSPAPAPASPLAAAPASPLAAAPASPLAPSRAASSLTPAPAPAASPLAAAMVATGPSRLTPAATEASEPAGDAGSLTPVASAATAPAPAGVPSATVAPAPPAPPAPPVLPGPFVPDTGTPPVGTGPAPGFPVVTPAPLDPRRASRTTAISSAAPASGSAAPAARPARPPAPGARKRPPAARVYQSVLTGNVRPLAEVKLAAMGLRYPLDLCIGAYGDDHEDRTQLIHLARRRACAVYGNASSDFSGTATIVVGDTPLDIEAALKAGARAVGVATGGYSAKTLQEAGAHAVLTDLTNTAAVLTALLS